MLSSSGIWATNYPAILKNRPSSRSSAMKSSFHEIIRLTVCQPVTSVQGFLVLFSSITWTVNEIQKAACTRRFWHGPLGYCCGSELLKRINDMGGPADPAESTGQVLLLTFTETTIMVNYWQCKHSSRDAQKSCSWTRAIIKRINFKSLPKHLWWSDHKAQSKC